MAWEAALVCVVDTCAEQRRGSNNKGLEVGSWSVGSMGLERPLRTEQIAVASAQVPAKVEEISWCNRPRGRPKQST